MIEGEVNAPHEAVVRLSLIDSSGQTRDIEAGSGLAVTSSSWPESSWPSAVLPSPVNRRGKSSFLAIDLPDRLVEYSTLGSWKFLGSLLPWTTGTKW